MVMQKYVMSDWKELDRWNFAVLSLFLTFVFNCLWNKKTWKLSVLPPNSEHLNLEHYRYSFIQGTTLQWSLETSIFEYDIVCDIGHCSVYCNVGFFAECDLTSVNSHLADTSLLRAPRYYRQTQNPRQKLQMFNWNKLPLLQSYRHFIRSQRHNFIVFSLVTADTEQHLGIFAHMSSLFFLLFETILVLNKEWISSFSLWWFKWLTGQTRLLLVKIRKLWPSKLCSS